MQKSAKNKIFGHFQVWLVWEVWYCIYWCNKMCYLWFGQLLHIIHDWSYFLKNHFGPPLDLIFSSKSLNVFLSFSFKFNSFILLIAGHRRSLKVIACFSFFVMWYSKFSLYLWSAMQNIKFRLYSTLCTTLYQKTYLLNSG